MFYFDEINHKKILKSDYLTCVQHFFTTRESVVEQRDLPELKDLCVENIEIISRYLKINKKNIICPTQTHSSNIKIAKSAQLYPDTDSLIVEDNDIAILLNFADCTPVILYDNANNIGAVVHAGWRGTASSIVPKTISLMQSRYSTNIQDITAVIGPAISAANYQVNRDVCDALRTTLNGEYTDCFFYDSINNKYNVDLKTINYYQLRELGIERIDKCKYCTYDSNDIFFSYRKENGKTARHSAILKLN